MGELYNLTNANVKLYDGPTRNMDPTFSEAYFDKTRDTGYGGYHYDGRWKPVAQEIINRYGVKAGQRILDIGCGKGFLLSDFPELCPGMEVRGTEVSKYAIENAREEAKSFIDLVVDEKLPYPDNHFDFVASINVLHFLTPKQAENGICEMLRVCKNEDNFFIQVDAFMNEVEKERLLAWAPIIKSVLSVDEWLEMFDRAGYRGDYYWTFVRPQTPEKFQSQNA
jgi:ubiquinone/menaquinone biosynthesis C-methylase UbiE